MANGIEKTVMIHDKDEGRFVDITRHPDGGMSFQEKETQSLGPWTCTRESDYTSLFMQFVDQLFMELSQSGASQSASRIPYSATDFVASVVQVGARFPIEAFDSFSRAALRAGTCEWLHKTCQLHCATIVDAKRALFDSAVNRARLAWADAIDAGFEFRESIKKLNHKFDLLECAGAVENSKPSKREVSNV